jgi:hypothetical protein
VVRVVNDHIVVKEVNVVTSKSGQKWSIVVNSGVNADIVVKVVRVVNVDISGQCGQ